MAGVAVDKEETIIVLEEEPLQWLKKSTTQHSSSTHKSVTSISSKSPSLEEVMDDVIDTATGGNIFTDDYVLDDITHSSPQSPKPTSPEPTSP